MARGIQRDDLPALFIAIAIRAKRPLSLGKRTRKLASGASEMGQFRTPRALFEEHELG